MAGPAKARFVKRSVLDNLIHALTLAGVPKTERIDHAERLAALGDLSGFENRAARKLSAESSNVSHCVPWRSPQDLIFR